MERIRRVLGRKATLSYLELHSADHCNIAAKGVDISPPIAEKLFPDLNQYKRDMQQLQKLYSQLSIQYG